MITMETIAEELNVSRTTVAYALGQNWRSARISPATREQILAKAQELGYQRNAIAASLKNRVTKTIGIVIPVVDGDEMLHGIEGAVGEEYTLFLGVSEYDKEREQRLLRSFQQRMVDGLIVIHSGHAENISLLQHLVERHVPIIQADRHYENLQTDMVEADNEALGATLTEHFLQRGFRNIAFLRSTVIVSNTLDRAAGYERTMRAHGLTPRLLPAQPVVSAQSRKEFAYALVRDLLRDTPRPLALVTHDLSLVAGAMKAAREAGVESSKDFAIGTVADTSDTALYDFIRTDLTMAVWSMRDMGFQAGKLLLQRLRQPANTRWRPQQIKIPCRLVRGTTD